MTCKWLHSSFSIFIFSLLLFSFFLCYRSWHTLFAFFYTNLVNSRILIYKPKNLYLFSFCFLSLHCWTVKIPYTVTFLIRTALNLRWCNITRVTSSIHTRLLRASGCFCRLDACLIQAPWRLAYLSDFINRCLQHFLEKVS